ncbi:CLUMA_CG015341, isoform A [Clunio marinus]|uniref:CLUMA_CG015341, isoform A n=1 Tax=Clunio marinus TaxID=568069 RepID=A0A1J1ISA2_9DIPT|nr:CLUMA_CG015341, isoform A [Clunio marinus]
MIFLILFVVLVYCTYTWSIKDHDYFEKIGLPYNKPLPLFGNMLDVLLQRRYIVDLVKSEYYKHKDTKLIEFIKVLTRRIAYYVFDPELVKRITIKDFDHFVNHSDEVTSSDKMFNKSLVALRDKKWREMRTALSPIFTSSKMKMMYENVVIHAENFTRFYENRARKGEILIIDALDTFARFTADGIATSVFGFHTDCVVNQQSNTFRIVKKMVHDFFGPLGILKFMFAFAFPKVYKFLGIQAMSREIYNFFKRVVIDVMDERDRNNIYRPDVIQLLLQVKKGQLKMEEKNDFNDKDLTNFAASVEYDVGTKISNVSSFEKDDWIAQGFIFFGAGFDTTSNLLQMTCYELSKNEKVQRELQEEVDKQLKLLDGKSITYEALHKMKYLDMVVSEGLRMWPPGPLTDRSCIKDYDLDLGNGRQITIKKGQVLNIPIQLFHHDPEYFPEPNKFNPNRFSDENKKLIVPGTYLPFGMGPRACIGSRFALMEAKLLLFYLMSKFNVEKCEKTPENVYYEPNMSFRIKEKIFLKLKLRN